MRRSLRTTARLLAAGLVFACCAGRVAAADLPAGSAQPAVAAPVDFVRDIQPVFAQNCYKCHDAAHHKGGMRLDSKATAFIGGDSGEASIVPHDSEKSRLIQLVRGDDPNAIMPPKGKRLSAHQVDLLVRWVKQGANWPDGVDHPSAGLTHWSFIAPVRPLAPAVNDSVWVRNPIDNFVLDGLTKAGLKPSPEADRYTLVRRLYLDLIGIPPTPAQVHQFVADTAPDAYERLVDGLMSNPHYGEKWARQWLDLARYADSAGYGSDPLRYTTWRWRDWVIDALNQNKPYDQFTIEQIAGDLLPHPTTDQLIATAFNRNTMTNTEGGTDPEEFRVEAIKDRTDTTIQVWMGLTMGCAKCHSHKYDPITNREYYQVFAFFNQTQDANRQDESPTIPTPTPGETARMDSLKAGLDEVQEQLDEDQTPQQRELDRKQLAMLKKELAGVKLTATAIMRELPADKRRQSYVLVKGNFLAHGPQVQPAVPAAFNPFPKDAPQNRLGLARWIVAKDNPLTARVEVNRIWNQLFGTGIVETQEDFGTQGQPPSNQALLDWLAVEFMNPSEQGATPWDMKRMVRLIVTSAAYRQSSRATPQLVEKDPHNRLISRGPSKRLEAEFVRDEALSLSGLLSPRMHGPSVYPPQPDGLWQAAFNGERTYPTSTGEDRYRRGIYVFWRRTVPYPSMAAFDEPTREVCTLRRIQTSTPLQAFVTLNDPVYVECAQALARRIMTEGGATTEQRARYALELCLCRPPQPRQLARLIELHDRELEHFQSHQQAAIQMATSQRGSLPARMPAPDAAAWTVCSNVLLNLDGVLTKR